MLKKSLRKLSLILMLVSLVLALMPLTSLAQDDEGGEDDHSAETAESEDHAEEDGGSPLVALGINGGFFLAQVVNFLFIFTVLSLVLWKPALNMITTRTTTIQKGLEDAAAAARARQNAEAEADKILAEARAERQKMLEEARGQGDEVRKTLEGEARQEAERIRTDANADAENSKSAALAEVRGDVLNIATAVAARILGEKIDAKKNSALVDNFLSKLPDGAKNLSGDIEIVSAMPLTDAEKAKVEKGVGGDNYSYTVNPSILGGLIVRSQDKVVDGSVVGGLNDVSEQLS